MANKKTQPAKSTKKVLKKEYILKPDYDTVIVEELTHERISAGGILIPETVDAQEEEDVRSGYVVAIGPNSNPNRPFLFSKGDLITFGIYNGRRLRLNGKDYLVLRHLDVLVSSSSID